MRKTFLLGWWSASLISHAKGYSINILRVFDVRRGSGSLGELCSSDEAEVKSWSPERPRRETCVVSCVSTTTLDLGLLQRKHNTRCDIPCSKQIVVAQSDYCTLPIILDPSFPVRLQSVLSAHRSSPITLPKLLINLRSIFNLLPSLGHTPVFSP